MIQVYVGGEIAYDSRLEEYDLLSLQVTNGLNKGGTATIVMPPLHPSYDMFAPYKPVVEVYRDTKLRFRGRPLPSQDNNTNQRTVTCEGERCFFRDAVSRPYLYQDTPAAIFTAVVQVYNDQQLDAAKRFRVGTVTVVDDNDYVRFESETDEKVSATLDKLVDRCGGYITFTTAPDGAREINWLAALDYKSHQVIEFGENLLDFARSGGNVDPITAVLPRGAKDEETGLRVTIESVNGGVDYIQDDEAVERYGFRIEPVEWDDVTLPENLLRKAQTYLEGSRYVITSLRLTALDLSYLDRDIDSFDVGDRIPVLSKPHRVDEEFLLTDKTEDLLRASGSISLGKDTTTLTGAGVAGDKAGLDALHKTTHSIKSDYTLNLAQAIQQTELLLASLIEQTSQQIKLEVSETYTTNEQVTAAVSTSMTQLSDSFTFTFNELKTIVDANDVEMREHVIEQQKYIRFEDGKILLGTSDPGSMVLTLENDLIIFRRNATDPDDPDAGVFGWWDGVDFHTGNIVVEVNERAQFGNFAFVPRSNGSLSFLKVKG